MDVAKIILHALGATMGGAMRHITNFFPLLALEDKKNHYLVLLRNVVSSISTSENIELKKIPDSVYGSFFNRMAFDLITLPSIVKKEHTDILVSLTNFGPIYVSCPHIIFQRNPVYYSHYYLTQIGKMKLLEVMIRRFYTYLIMKNARIVVTPSVSMANMIQNKYPQLNKNKFKVIYHGFNQDQRTHETYGWQKYIAKEKIKILYTSHPGLHKGYNILFDIIVELKKLCNDFVAYLTVSRAMDSPKVVAGYETRVKELGIADNVTFLGQIPQNQMRPLYEMCDLLIYPSLAESFGFSMIEALGYNLPIVASDTPVNREICGNGAAYYPSTDARQGALTIFNALKPEALDRLRILGKKRFASFDWGWERYAREFVAMINDVLQKST